ncbi:MAG: rRNA pseudouridine synthase [Clostridia bacterium]|nr:rRNA pseudouridine synthase [Clostridia bacterium]
MRLDKFIVSTGKLSRSEAGRAARSGRILVDGIPEKKADRAIDPEKNDITLDGELLTYRKFTYILMNKPDGYISASDSGRETDPIVLTLLPDELQRIGLFPCGRLDKHTTGLILLTNNGALAHRLLSPRHHVAKRYYYTSKFSLTEEEIATLQEGVTLEDGYVTLPAVIEQQPGATEGYITLTEGKYHQIKRMLEAVHNKILTLERVTFGPLTLQGLPRRGDWRYLNDEEIRQLEAHGQSPLT